MRRGTKLHGLVNFIVQVCRKAPLPSTIGSVRGVKSNTLAKVSRPLLAFALLVCVIGPAWCATDMAVSQPNAGAGPTPVNVYLYVVDVFDVSGSDQTFNADVVLIAEWRDPKLAGKGTAIRSAKLEDVWEPRLQLVNQRGGNAMLPQRVEIHPEAHSGHSSDQ